MSSPAKRDSWKITSHSKSIPSFLLFLTVLMLNGCKWRICIITNEKKSLLYKLFAYPVLNSLTHHQCCSLCWAALQLMKLYRFQENSCEAATSRPSRRPRPSPRPSPRPEAPGTAEPISDEAPEPVLGCWGSFWCNEDQHEDQQTPSFQSFFATPIKTEPVWFLRVRVEWWRWCNCHLHI